MNVVTVERVLLTPAERDALCATVQALRAELNEWASWHVMEPNPCGHHPCHRYDLRVIADNPNAAHGCASCEVVELQSQLAQVTQERDELRRYV